MARRWTGSSNRSSPSSIVDDSAWPLAAWSLGSLCRFLSSGGLVTSMSFCAVTCDTAGHVQHPCRSGGRFLTGQHFLYPARIAELEVSDENDINWDLLAEGWSSVRSPQWLRSKWWTIKRQIANHKDVSFPGNVMLAHFSSESPFHICQRNKAAFCCLLTALLAKEHIAPLLEVTGPLDLLAELLLQAILKCFSQTSQADVYN